MCVVDDRYEHLAGVIETEGLFDQPAFTLEGGAFELDPKGFAEDLHGVGVGVQGSRDGGHQVLLLREPFERLFDHRLSGAGSSDHKTQTALLAVDAKRVVDFLMV